MIVALASETSTREQRFRLSSIDWPSYVAIGELLRDRPIRMTYDRGELELMTTSLKHEHSGHVWGILLFVIAEEMSIDVRCGGSMTFQRQDLKRGLEPDECWWIQNEPAVREKDTWDPDIDPPPDLVLEVEISRSALNRMAIYQALGVPEVWRYDGETVDIHLLGTDGKYHESTQSRAFPFLLVAELVRFVHLRTTMSDTAIARAFRDWVREQMASGWANGGNQHAP